MTKILHTADWQIGKPFLSITDKPKRYRVQRERLLVIDRISKVAEQEKVDAVVIAGDLFDSAIVPAEVVMESFEGIGKMQRPVLVIPGNHDHGGEEGIWERVEVKEYIKKRAPNMIFLNKKRPLLTSYGLFIPCPLLRRTENEDPLEWINRIKFDDYDSNIPRIIIAHGSVHGFEGKDYEEDEDIKFNRFNSINIHNIDLKQIDYIALGDWHNFKKVSEKAFYSGTPEPDRFNKSKDEYRGQVLIAEIERNKRTNVKRIETCGLRWHSIKAIFQSEEDFIDLEKNISKIIGGRVGKDLLRIEVGGYLSETKYQEFNKLVTELNTQLLYLRQKGFCRQMPEIEEVKKLVNQIEDPIISTVSESLIQELKSNRKEQLSKHGKRVIELALCELNRICAEERKLD